MLFVQFRRIWFCLGRHRQLPPRDVSRCHAGPLLVSRAILSALPWAGRRQWVIVAGVGSGTREQRGHQADEVPDVVIVREAGSVANLGAPSGNMVRRSG
jgi:hypothetical protein